MVAIKAWSQYAKLSIKCVHYDTTGQESLTSYFITDTLAAINILTDRGRFIYI